VRVVAKTVDRECAVSPRGAEREVDHVDALLHGPGESAEEDLRLAREARSEYADTRDARLGSELMDDRRTGGAVAEQVLVRPALFDDLAALEPQRQAGLIVDSAFERRMRRVDADVDEGHAYALAGGAS